MNTNILIEHANKKCWEAQAFILKYSQTENNTELAKALDLYYESITLFPRQSEPYIAIAYICTITNKLNEAKKLLNKALEIDPNNLFAIKMLQNLRTRIAKEQLNPVQQQFEMKQASKEKDLSSQSKILLTKLRPEKLTKPEAEDIGFKQEFINNLKKIQEEMRDSKVKITVNENTFNKLSLLKWDDTKPVHTGHEKIPVKNTNNEIIDRQTKTSTKQPTKVQNREIPSAPEKIRIKVSENTLNILSDNAKTSDFSPVFNLFDD